MTLKHLKIFIEVFNNKNVTKAAEKLYMTQPAVTRAIKELENYYGVVLFERLNRGISPTEAGQNLYFRATSIIANMESLNSSLQDWDNIGSIRLGSTISLGIYLLPLVVDKLKSLHPHLNIKVYVENAEKLQERITHNEVDICFVEGLLPDRNLIIKPFSTDEMVLAVPNNEQWKDITQIKMKDLENIPFCTREKGSISRYYAEEAFYSHGLVPNIVAESESTQSILRLVSHGLGVSILPKRMIQKDLQDSLIRQISILDAELSRTNYIVWHKDKYLTKTMEEIISWEFI